MTIIEDPRQGLIMVCLAVGVLFFISLVFTQNFIQNQPPIESYSTQFDWGYHEGYSEGFQAGRMNNAQSWYDGYYLHREQVNETHYRYYDYVQYRPDVPDYYVEIHWET